MTPVLRRSGDRAEGGRLNGPPGAGVRRGGRGRRLPYPFSLIKQGEFPALYWANQVLCFKRLILPQLLAAEAV